MEEPSTEHQSDFISMVDFRVGRIVAIKKHEDADTLFVERVDIGKEEPVTVVSSLVGVIPLEELEGKLAIFICNLKPVRMRGVVSEAMILVGAQGDKLELPILPKEAYPGDQIKVEGFCVTPVEKLPPKKKIFEKAQQDMRIEAGSLYFKTGRFFIEGKGLVRMPTLQEGRLS